MFKKILVANRGEIALRVIRTCKEMGIQTVAVYSTADAESLHVKFADEAVCIGPALSSESYLKVANIIAAAEITNADAIHPGYGFLSENARFSKICEEHGIKFIGASPEMIDRMGDKANAKATMKAAGVPCVPGSEGVIETFSECKKTAKKTGYPVMLKASAGGGGKGMRVVNSDAECRDGFERAQNESRTSFGDDRVFAEKFITEPHHIEIQILGDQQGNLVYLFERECSIQRRHQKVIEEAPSAVVSPAMRTAMGEAAIGVAKACNYYGAGTVEFIVDEKLNFYFLEMNTRLQVEHPVTEMITGKDLVREQIWIAEGKSLSFAQEDLTIQGHAVEVRVYAEDPKNNFLPDIGKLHTYRRPQGPGIRVDDGFEEGMEIPIYYDPMIAKLIAHGATREVAIDRMIRAIDDYRITGIQTTLDFCRFALEHDAFRSGNFDTKFVEQYFRPELLEPQFTEEEKNLLAALSVEFFEQEDKRANPRTALKTSSTTNWTNRLI